MNKEQLEYNIIISPNLRFRKKKKTFIVKNVFNGNEVIFINDSIKNLFDYFSESRKIKDALSVIKGDISENQKVIERLIEWDFLITDLGLTERSCPLCNSKTNRILVEHRNDYYQKVFKYVKCENCNFVFLNPAPTEEVLNFFYAFKNYYSIIPFYSNQKFEKKLELKSNILRSSVLQEYCHLNETTAIMDVGCGTGNFASYLSLKYNCNITCVDKDPLALSFISENYPQITIMEKDFKKVDVVTKYDIITMWGYIEHEFDPKKTLEKAYELLKENGLLIIDAPNINGTLANKSIINWPYLHSPYHMCHFETITMLKLTKISGFKTVDVKYKKTGAFLLKYSDFILRLIYKYKLFYSCSSIDYFFFLLSKILRKGENKSDSRILIVVQK